MDDFFLSGSDFGYLADIAAEWLAYGIGLGAIVWVLGAVVGLIWSFLRY